MHKILKSKKPHRLKYCTNHAIQASMKNGYLYSNFLLSYGILVLFLSLPKVLSYKIKDLKHIQTSPKAGGLPFSGVSEKKGESKLSQDEGHNYVIEASSPFTCITIWIYLNGFMVLSLWFSLNLMLSPILHCPHYIINKIYLDCFYSRVMQ